MPDTQIDSQVTSTVPPVVPSIVYLNNKPHWELAAKSMWYPVKLEDGRYVIYVEMKQPYSLDVLKDALFKSRGAIRTIAGKTTTLDGDKIPLGNLIDDSFLQFVGTNLQNPADQKAYLDNRPQVKAVMAVDTLGGVMFDRGISEDDGEEILHLVINAEDSKIHMYQELVADPQKKKIVRVDMVHRFRPETEKQWRQYKKSGVTEFVRSKGAAVETVDYDKRIALYDELVTGVDGMCFNGVPCGTAGREWVALVPPWHKLWAIQNLFVETRVKNG